MQALVLTPTRELAVQVAGVIDELGAPRGLKTLMISGGRAFGPQRDELRRGVHVVVGTPGRVLDLLNQGAIWLDRVRFLVLDEADEMLDRGFAPDVERIIARTTPDRQTALFSATVPSWVKQTASKHLHDPETVTIVPEPGEVTQIEHLAFEIGANDKMQRPAGPARPSRRWLGDRLRAHQARREQARPPLAGGRLPGGGAAGEPVAERARPGDGRLPQRAGAGPGGDECRRAWAGRQPRGAGDQRRAAGIAGAAHPPHRPHRPHGAAGAGDHAAWLRRT